MVVVKIKNGKIRGRIAVDQQNSTCFSFQNIPYATPPLGYLRFKAPQPALPWNGIKDCTKEGNESVSSDLVTKKIVGSEDCLNLNVYTPELPQDGEVKALKPVMFWVHGGLFMTGSNKTIFFGPEFLIPEGVVLVTINYRLGILGFLSLEDPSLKVPGNAALKDVVMGLKWVQSNIASFGGNPENVTVFGESAGAAVAHLMMLSPMTKGLFHKAICQSGSALNTWIFGRKSAKEVAEELGFLSGCERKILEFLQTVPANDFVKVQKALDHKDFVENRFRFFGVVVEAQAGEEAFLSERPLDVIASGKYHHVPLIMGYNHREGMAFERIIPKRARKSFFENLELSVPLTLNLERGSRSSRQIAKEIQHFYFGNAKQTREKHLNQYFDLVTDTAFFRDVCFSVLHHIKTSCQPIYFYKLSLETELNVFKKLTGETSKGVYHGDDIGYLFKTIFTPEILPKTPEKISQKRMVRLWTNFARFGNPTPKPKDPLLKILWKKVQVGELHYLEIGPELAMKLNPEPERMEFWRKIFKMHLALCKL